jgi:hypothetical protein
MVLRCVAALVLAGVLAGCGGRREAEEQPLTFEDRSPPPGQRRDTTGLSTGEPLLTRLDPWRQDDGAVRVRGRLDFPDSTRLQVTIYRTGTDQVVERLQVYVRNGRFETPPIVAANGPLPAGRYRVEYFTLFNPVWQTPEVMRRTGDGRSLRGPGVTRDQAGGAAFYLVEERTL